MLKLNGFIVTLCITTILYGHVLGQEVVCNESCRCLNSEIQCNTTDFTLVYINSTLNIACKNNMSVEGLDTVNKLLNNQSNIFELNLNSCALPEKPLIEAIDGLDELENLSIDGSHSRLSSFATTLQNMTTIKKLTLTNLGLKMGDITFESMNNLVFLNMTGNNFSEITGIMEGHQNLSSLDLSFNNLTTFKVVKNICEVLPGLRYLDLSGNRGMKDAIQNDTFQYCSGLTELHLADLGLDTFDLGSWNLEELSVIDMSYNNFTTISTDDLMASRSNDSGGSLSICLSNNRIKNIYTGNKTFSSNVKTIKFLDLSNNHLTNIHDTVLEFLNASDLVAEFKLGGNPWKCDCNFKNTSKFVRDNARKVSDMDYLKCSNMNLLVKDSTDSVLCATKNMHYLWITLAVVVVVLIVGVLYINVPGDFST